MYPVIFIAEHYSIIWIDHYLFTHSPVDGYLNCFPLEAILNEATMARLDLQISSNGDKYSSLLGVHLGADWFMR